MMPSAHCVNACSLRKKRARQAGPSEQRLRTYLVVAVVAVTMMRVAMAAPDVDVNTRSVSVDLTAMEMAAMAVAPACNLFYCRRIRGDVCAG